MLEFVIQELWERLVEATHERFGWLAAAVVALASVMLILLAICLIVLLIS